MTETELLAFLRNQRWAVQASVSAEGTPQSALVGIAVTDRLEIFFDTLAATRKARNLRANPRISFVIGGWIEGNERTVQYEGVADFPAGEELDRLKGIYFSAFPDGPSREVLPGITYIRVKPRWVRYSNFGVNPPEVAELRFP